MSLLRDVVAALLGMFIADLRLTLAILATVALASLLHLAGAPGWLVGLALTTGAMGAILAAILSQARRGR